MRNTTKKQSIKFRKQSLKIT